MVDVEREWRNLPETGRPAPLVVTKERHHFSLADLRAIPERLTRPAAWNEDGNEPAIMLAVTMSIGPLVLTNIGPPPVSDLLSWT
jgi:hypothetical protein